MKTKYFLVYVFVGIAFLAVSVWVFLARGKNAKALRAKYRLGGIMLTAWAMLSVASCGEVQGPGEIMCYDPVSPEDQTRQNKFDIWIESSQAHFKANELTIGDKILVTVANPSYEKYVLKIFQSDKDNSEVQKAYLVVADAQDGLFTIILSDSVTYKGDAYINVFGLVGEDPETLTQTVFGNMIIRIL